MRKPNEARIAEIAAWQPEKPAPVHPDFRAEGRTTGRKRARSKFDAPVREAGVTFAFAF